MVRWGTSSTSTLLAAGAGASAALFCFARGRRVHRRAVRHGIRVIDRGQPLSSEPTQISVASWNILCEKFATPQRLPHVPPQFLDYDYRWPRIQDELRNFGADVICLQEVTVQRVDEISAFMANLGYQGIVQKKPHDFFLALFFRTSKLSLTWSEERSRALMAELQLKTNTTTNSTSNTAENTTGIAENGTGRHGSNGNGSTHINNNNKAIIGEHSNNTNNQQQQQQQQDSEYQPVYIVNVHLEGSPYRPNDRVSQIRHALQRLEHHLETKGLDPKTARVLICGDFNSLPTDSPCDFLRKGVLEADHVEAHLPEIVVTKETIHHGFMLRDVYQEAHAVPPFTRKVNNSGARMDFVWASSGLGLDAVLRPLKDEHKELAMREFLPNKLQPSDHLPVGAVLNL